MSNRILARRDFDKLEQRRLRASALFDEGLTKADVARELRVSFASARRWYESWRAKGSSGLRKAGRAGRRPRLLADQLQQIELALEGSPRNYGIPATRWTIRRVRTLIQILTGIDYHPQHVGRILHRHGLVWRTKLSLGARRFDSLAMIEV